MKKITPQEYTDFVHLVFMNSDWKHLRFGQAFMVYFYPNCGLVDPDLFYTEDLSQAVEIIFSKYVELEGNV